MPGRDKVGGKVSEPLAKKRLGQHWLSDSASLQAMCTAAHITHGDVVFEIGPGTGLLTNELLKSGAQVEAIELDEDRLRGLTEKFKGQAFNLYHGSILKFDLTTLPTNYKIVANIPYYLTNNLFRLLSESSNPPSMAVLLVQKEVAERVTAEAGSMSLLSITTQFYWDVSAGTVIPGRLFTPPPKVDSQILILKRRQKLPYEVDEKTFFRLIKSGFASRRKTLVNSLSGGLRIEKGRILEVLALARIDSQYRPQELSLDQWYKLYSSCLSAGIL